jgi:hypothetical protein
VGGRNPKDKSKVKNQRSKVKSEKERLKRRKKTWYLLSET